ncbi:phytanoyl-CoA dioxygenase family protein [Colwellia sp. RE-S-Sl-9]
MRVNHYEVAINNIEQDQGFFVGAMSEGELKILRAFIRDQYLARLLMLAPKEVKHFYHTDMSNYHELSDKVEHRKMWPKNVRILGPNAFETILALPFFQTLKERLDIQAVATEEGCGWQEMYWRIVRPGNSDIGDYHADKWFWDLGHGTMPEGMRRLKIWIAIHVVKNKSGLCVIPGSHLKNDWKYHGEVDHTGIAKPKFDEDVSQLSIYDVPTQSGDFIVFHDGLIHRGMENKSDKTRVSLEATLLVPDLNLNNT